MSEKNISENKTFLVYRHQQGQGCDYTIGCGVSVSIHKAESLEKLIDKLLLNDVDWKSDALKIKDPGAREEYFYNLSCDCYIDNADKNSENYCRKILLYEVISETDLLPLMQNKLVEIKKYQEELDKKASDEYDLQEFERLKKKLGK